MMIPQSRIRSVNNMAGNCLINPFLLNYIRFYAYFVKKRDSYQIFSLSMKILWEPGSQVRRHYPTLFAIAHNSSDTDVHKNHVWYDIEVPIQGSMEAHDSAP